MIGILRKKLKFSLCLMPIAAMAGLLNTERAIANRLPGVGNYCHIDNPAINKGSNSAKSVADLEQQICRTYGNDPSPLGSTYDAAYKWLELTAKLSTDLVNYTHKAGLEPKFTEDRKKFFSGAQLMGTDNSNAKITFLNANTTIAYHAGIIMVMYKLTTPDDADTSTGNLPKDLVKQMEQYAQDWREAIANCAIVTKRFSKDAVQNPTECRNNIFSLYNRLAYIQYWVNNRFPAKNEDLKGLHPINSMNSLHAAHQHSVPAPKKTEIVKSLDAGDYDLAQASTIILEQTNIVKDTAKFPQPGSGLNKLVRQLEPTNILAVAQAPEDKLMNTKFLVVQAYINKLIPLYGKTMKSEGYASRVFDDSFFMPQLPQSGTTSYPNDPLRNYIANNRARLTFAQFKAALKTAYQEERKKLLDAWAASASAEAVVSGGGAQASGSSSSGRRPSDQQRFEYLEEHNSSEFFPKEQRSLSASEDGDSPRELQDSKEILRIKQKALNVIQDAPTLQQYIATKRSIFDLAKKLMHKAKAQHR